jgi:hypothetical protein
MFETLKQLPKAIVSELIGKGSGATARHGPTEQQRAALARLVAGGDVLMTSNELRALYHLGRYDVLLRPTRLSEVAPGREFARDHRTGGPVISTVQSLHAVVECHARGSMLVWDSDWGLPYAINIDLARAIETRMKEVEVPGPLEVRVFRWEHVASADPECVALRDALSSRPRVPPAPLAK